jgi:hypothetical protein
LSTSEMSFSLHHCYLGTLLLGICAVKGLRWTHKASVLILGFFVCMLNVFKLKPNIHLNHTDTH